MRRAINTYQGGGQFEFDPQGRMVPVQPWTPPTPEVTQEQPQQPSPGAAGQTTPAQPTPSKAIDTSGLVKVVPEPPMTDPDQDMNIWAEREYRQFEDPDTARVLSHRGDNRPLMSDAEAKQYRPEFHADWPKYQEAIDLVNQFAQSNPTFSQKLAKQAKDIGDRIRREQKDAFKMAHEKAKSEAAADARTLDARPLPATQEEKLDDTIRTSTATYDATMYTKNPAIVSPQDKHDANEARTASPLNTMTETERNRVVRDLVYLNRDKIGVDDAVRILMNAGSPVKPGADALNGLRGKAAARFEPHGVDAVGNRFIKMKDGMVVRMSPGVYELLAKKRSQGYDAAAKFRSELDRQREEERKPGFVGRNILQPLGLQ